MRNHDSGEFVNRVVAAELFVNVGQPIAENCVLQVKGWKEAINSSESQEWEDFCLDRYNEVVSCCPVLDAKEGKAWNDGIKHVESILEDPLRSQINQLPLSAKDQESLFNSAMNNFVVTWREIELDEKTASQWHQELVEWYFRGHFPCGWDGDWPQRGKRKGRLIVF